jgi:hypothetical protein
MLEGAAVVDCVTLTSVSAATLDGPKLTVAVESVLEIVPPPVGDTIDGGGDSPLAVFAFGSGVVPEVPVGVVPPVDGGVVDAVLPTTTLPDPVPDPEVVVVVPAPFAGSPVPVVA